MVVVARVRGSDVPFRRPTWLVGRAVAGGPVKTGNHFGLRFARSVELRKPGGTFKLNTPKT